MITAIRRRSRSSYQGRRRRGHRGMAQVRADALPVTRGLAGDAGRTLRVRAQACRVLRSQSDPGRTPPRRLRTGLMAAEPGLINSGRLRRRALVSCRSLAAVDLELPEGVAVLGRSCGAVHPDVTAGSRYAQGLGPAGAGDGGVDRGPRGV